MNLYDAISERNVVSRISGTASFSVPSDGVCLLTVILPVRNKQFPDIVCWQVTKFIDFYYGYDYSRNLRLKAIVADQEVTVPVIPLN